jgi:hypothetical protein
VRKLLVLAIIGAAVAALVRVLRGDPAPQFSTHPSVLGGPDLDAGTRRIVLPAEPTPEPEPKPTPETQPEPEPEPEPEAEPQPEAATEAAGATWVAPVDGACPEGYPIKAKLKSGIFHQPGGLAYDRTKPDRCYPDAASAEADGLRPAKR